MIDLLIVLDQVIATYVPGHVLPIMQFLFDNLSPRPH